MDLALSEWIAVAAIGVAIILAVIGWILNRPSQVQKQNVKNGIGIQAGGDIQVGDK